MTTRLSFFASLTIAGLAFLVGSAIAQRVPILKKYYVPGPIIGGLLAAFAFFLADLAGFPFVAPASGQPVAFLAAFLTTNMGLHVTPKVLRHGYKLFFLFFLMGVAIYFAQLLLVFPIALLNPEPLRAALLLGPLSFSGIPFPPAGHLEPLVPLLRPVVSDPQTFTQTQAILGILLSAIVPGIVSTRLFKRAGQEPPRPSPAERKASITLWSFATDMVALVVLILVLIQTAFLVQTFFIERIPALRPGYLPLTVVSYLLGALFRLVFEWLPGVKFPGKALTVLLLGPTMGLVLTYAVMTLPLHYVRLLTIPMVLAGLLAITASGLVAWFAFALFARFTDRYYAAVISVVLLAVTIAVGPAGMSYVRHFTDEEGPVPPLPIILPLNAFYILPWMVTMITLFLLGGFD